MKNNFVRRTKERMKKFFIKLKNKDTSFFIIVLCVCLLSTAVIWRYVSHKNDEKNNLSQSEQSNEDGINANMDPYNDYVNKVKEDYEKKSEEQKNEEPDTEKLDLNTMKTPLEGEVIKEYAMDNLVYFDAIGEWRVHKGVDIKPKDTLMIESAFAGKVESVSESELTGTEIVIDHGNNVKTLYNNLASSKVKVGDSISRGQVIGNIGKCASIESSDGPHLHFELMVDGKSVNPKEYIPEDKNKEEQN